MNQRQLDRLNTLGWSMLGLSYLISLTILIIILSKGDH